MGAGKDENGLICVGQQHLSVHAAGPWIEADDGARAILDCFDDTRSIRLNLDLNAIAEGHQVTLGLAALQLAAQAADECALLRGNREEA
jgi:hypothetical protein